MLPLLVLLGTIAGAWYLLIVRPQKEQQTRHGELVGRLRVGDHVLTVGGIYGQVVAVEGPSVVLELSPGLTSRIATDGIARIVHAGDGALPPPRQPAPLATQETPTALDTAMHQHPHPDQHAPQYAAPQFHAPAQPWSPPQAQPPTRLEAAAQPPAGSHEPRPWGDLAPVNQHHAGVPQQAAVAFAQPVAYPHPVQPARPSMQPARGTTIPSPPPLPTIVPQPFAPAAVAPAAVQHVRPAPASQAGPVVQPQLVPAHLAPAHLASAHRHPAEHPAQPAEPARRHSRAPQGMGSSLRLDDPSLRDTMARAQDERAELAEEYRRLMAPLVDVGGPAHGEPHAPGRYAPAELHSPPGAAFVGHDPTGVPLFAAPGSPVAHPVAQFPAPARLDAVGGMPRPLVQAPGAAVDPALTSSAFQRRTPYAPDPALQPKGTPQPQPALA